MVDASAGVEIIARTNRGAALRRLIPDGAQQWVPQHFYAEVLAGLRRLTVFDRKLTDAQAAAALTHLQSWHLREAVVRPLLPAAWTYRHNLTAGDAIYVALAEHLGASLLTDDHRLADSPTLPANLIVLRLPVRLLP